MTLNTTTPANCEIPQTRNIHQSEGAERRILVSGCDGDVASAGGPCLRACLRACGSPAEAPSPSHPWPELRRSATLALIKDTRASLIWLWGCWSAAKTDILIPRNRIGGVLGLS